MSNYIRLATVATGSLENAFDKVKELLREKGVTKHEVEEVAVCSTEHKGVYHLEYLPRRICG